MQRFTSSNHRVILLPMKNVLKIFKGKPNALETAGLLVAFSFLSLVVHRFILQCLIFVLIFLIVMRLLCSAHQWPVICYNICILLCGVSLFCPLDLAIRASDAWHLRHVRILWIPEDASSKRIREEKGLVENQDYVVYHGWKTFIGPRWVILVTVPVQGHIHTPLLN